MYGGGGDSGLCKFFSKMGACRNGDTCTLFHQRPTQSPTVMFPMMYPNPLAIENLPDHPYSFQYDKKYLKKHFERFYKNVWRTFMELGRIAELRVVSNLGDHLLGNVYIRFESKADAARVVEQLRKKSFEGILLLPELSPVVDFGLASCKEGECTRGGACNYLHIIKISKSTLEKLEKEQAKLYKKREEKQSKSRKRSRSKSPKERRRSRSRSRSPPKAAGDLCHLCGKAGHISRDCPLKP